MVATVKKTFSNWEESRSPYYWASRFCKEIEKPANANSKAKERGNIATKIKKLLLKDKVK